MRLLILSLGGISLSCTVILLLCCLLLANSLQARQVPSMNYFLDSPQTAKHAVIMVGPAVGDINVRRFRQWSFSLHDILVRDYGYSNERIILLYDRGETEFTGGERVDGAATREGISDALTNLRARVATGDQITLYLIGHGSGAGDEAKFNIVGPDLTGNEFAVLLDQFDRQDMVIVNTTSASYGFSEALSSEGRVVISSTRSPSERYDPVFSGYFIDALDGRKGDRDKNNRVSMLEAFEYARANVQQWYSEQGRLAPEHAGLDDNGDSLFSLDPREDQSDGLLAEIAYIDTLVDADAELSPSALMLKARMQELERSVFILRGRKDEFLEADYWQQMEPLLIELAQTTEQYDAQRKS